jgi:DeoR/GlpR family transcriptional regulator of sugar metabolism
LPGGHQASSAHSINERRWLIVQEVHRQQRLSVNQLSQRFGVSKVMIRRDLNHLEQAGLLRRVHGGAEALASSGQLSVFEARLLRNIEIKQALGQAATDLIHPGQVIFLDSGTTVLEIARQLPRLLADRATFTVVTRSLTIAAELRTQRRIRLIVVGGVYLHDFDNFVGSQVERALQEIHVDTLFIGTDGVSLERGLTTDNVREAGLYRAMARCAEEVVVVTDSSKIGADKLQATLAFSDIHTFVTDSGAPADFITTLHESGCEVLVVEGARQERLRHLRETQEQPGSA